MPDLREQLQGTLGDYLTLENELGGGGMSRVFVAHEASLGRKVVVKVLPPEMAAAVSIDRFRREIQLAAQLQHPHIVPLLSAGETEGLPYYTMPYVRGESLRARLSKGELPLAETIRILREVASALSYAHEAGVVHRDIKPENILISGGSAVVTDFGVAKALTASSGASGSSLTSLGVALGTPAYMAPEQATADPNIDNRADIYSLGVVAYEMLSGSTPFPGRSPQATLAAHVTESPEPITRRRASVSPALSALVMRCLEKHAADRPQTATEVMHALDAVTTPSGGTTPAKVQPAPSKRSKTLFTIASIAAVAIAVALATIASARVRREMAAAGHAESPAIAVLPFENVGRKEGQDFADGMTEEITNRLSALRGLRVIGRQSAKSYANSTKTPQEIAKELGVKYLLTGTVRWDKSTEGRDLVRVSPALLKGDDATQVWGDAYQTVLSGYFDVQSKVATEVANALNVNLLAPEREALEAQPTDNLQAYGLFLRGKQIFEENLQSGPLRQAAGLLESATDIDPKFAAAWAYLAIAHTEVFWYSTDKSQRELELARQALSRASSLDPNDPDVHLARGIYKYHAERDYGGALQELNETVRSRPSDVNAAIYIVAIRKRLGKFDEAVDGWKRVVDLEPRNGANMIDLASLLFFMQRYGESEAYVDRGMVLSPQEADGYRIKAANAIAVRGNVPEAVEHLRRGSQNVQPASSVIGMLENAVWPASEDPHLRQILIRATPSTDVSAGPLLASKATVYSLIGDVPHARATADSAIAALSTEITRTPQPTTLYQALALMQAIKGNRAAAMQAMANAEEALPAASDLYDAPERENLAADLLTIFNEQDAAVTALEKRVGVPGGLSRNYLRLNPRYAALRANPRFRRLIGDT